MKGKALFVAVMLLFVAIFAIASVSAQLVTIDEVEFDDDEVSPSSSTSIRNFERNQEVEVKVHFTVPDDSDSSVDSSADEVEIEVELTGYDGDRVRDTEYVDEVREGESYVERLTLDFPWDMDQDYYTLRVYVCPRSGDCVTETYELDVEAEEHSFVIKDVDFSPGLEVEAGRALLTTVRVQNVGDEEDDDGVKVKVSIPDLGLSASDYLDEVDEDDSTSSEELYIRIPSETPAGDYDVEVTVSFDDGDETVSDSYTLTVTEAEDSEEESSDDEESVESKTVLTVGSESQEMTAGQGGAVYPVTITNAAGEAKTYVVDVSGYDAWGDVRLDPSNVVVLDEGETQTVYLFASANEDASGSYTFAVTVSSGSETLKEMVLTADVEPAESEETSGSLDSVKKGLVVGVIVLVILLVILGLILVVNKLREDDDEDNDEKSKTYY